MDFYDFLVLIGCAFFISLIASLCWVGFIDVLDRGLMQNFCETNGFSHSVTGVFADDTYCYKFGLESSTKKEFLCEPAPDFLSTIGSCKFLKYEGGEE